MVGSGGIFSAGIFLIPNRLLREGLRFMFVPAEEATTGSCFVSIVLALLRFVDVLLLLAVEALRLLDLDAVSFER